MKTLYLDCSMGAAGDMLAGALLELLPDRSEVIRKLNESGLPEVSEAWDKSVKCGITGSRFKVLVKGMEEESVDVGAEDEHGHHLQEGSRHGGREDEHHRHESGHSHEQHHHEPCHSHEQHHHEPCHSHECHHHEPDHGHHHHSSLHRIEHLVKDHLSLPDRVKEDILAVYGLIAQAESQAHDVPVEEIHFHEVGTMDALADIAAVCLLMDKLSPKQVIVSPVHVGSGQVRCAHGILPVPAPATAYILRDVPVYGGKIKGELCTPTGAALLKYFATDFGKMPVMKIRAIGYGMGKKDFEAANCVRAMWGEQVLEEGRGQNLEQNISGQEGCTELRNSTENLLQDTIWELACNVDDMTAEEIGFALEEFLAAGALEVYTVPIGMKKSRPGTEICILCKEKEKKGLVQAIFKHTTTLGIRKKQTQRYLLERSMKEEESSLGKIHYKEAGGWGVSRKKYEYDELAALARKNKMGLREVRQKLGDSTT